MKPSFLEDVSSEIAISGPQEGVLSRNLLVALAPPWNSSWTYLSALGGHLEVILDHLRALLGHLVGLCRAVLKASKSDAKMRSMKAPFFEDVSSEIAILGPQEPQEGVLDHPEAMLRPTWAILGLS